MQGDIDTVKQRIGHVYDVEIVDQEIIGVRLAPGIRARVDTDPNLQSGINRWRLVGNVEISIEVGETSEIGACTDVSLERCTIMR
jgi:hypothetical protein